MRIPHSSEKAIAVWTASLTASRPVKLGDDNCRTRRKSYKKANQQVRKHRCASADRRQRFLSDKTAYYHRICRIIELLKKSSK